MAELAAAPGRRLPVQLRRAPQGLALVHDTNGPRVRWGIVWFLVTVTAAAVSQAVLGLVMALAAALAADQVMRLWDSDAAAAYGTRPRGLLTDPRRLPALLGAAALPLAAGLGADARAVAAALPALVVLTPVSYTHLTLPTICSV